MRFDYKRRGLLLAASIATSGDVLADNESLHSRTASSTLQGTSIADMPSPGVKLTEECSLWNLATVIESVIIKSEPDGIGLTVYGTMPGDQAWHETRLIHVSTSVDGATATYDMFACPYLHFGYVGGNVRLFAPVQASVSVDLDLSLLREVVVRGGANTVVTTLPKPLLHDASPIAAPTWHASGSTLRPD